MACLHANGNVSVQGKRKNVAGERGRLLLLSKWKGTGSGAQTGAWSHPSSSVVIGESTVSRRYGRNWGKF